MQRPNPVNRLLWKEKGYRRACNMVKRVAPNPDQVKITTESVNLSSATSDGKIVKGKGKYGKDDTFIYPDHKVKRATHLSDATNWVGEAYRDHKEPELQRRKHESNFFITLNTNKTVSPGASMDKGCEAVKHALTELAKDHVICEYLKFGPKNTEYVHDKFKDVIQSTSFDGAVEVGDKLNRLHCHIWLTVHHFSQIQVSTPLLQHVFKRIYNAKVDSFGSQYSHLKLTKKAYGQVKLLPSSDWAIVIRQYIHKAMAA